MSANLTPTWGYSANGAELFQLAEGDGLPDGYYDNPAKVPVKKKRGRPKKVKDNGNGE